MNIFKILIFLLIVFLILNSKVYSHTNHKHDTVDITIKDIHEHHEHEENLDLEHKSFMDIVSETNFTGIERASEPWMIFNNFKKVFLKDFFIRFVLILVLFFVILYLIKSERYEV